MQIHDFQIELSQPHDGNIPRVGSPYQLRHHLLIVNNRAICNSEVWLEYAASVVFLRLRLKGRIIFTADRFDEVLIIPRDELEFS